MTLLLDSYERILQQLKTDIEEYKLRTDDDCPMQGHHNIVYAIEREISSLKESIFRIAYNKHLKTCL